MKPQKQIFLITDMYRLHISENTKGTHKFDQYVEIGYFCAFRSSWLKSKVDTSEVEVCIRSV